MRGKQRKSKTGIYDKKEHLYNMSVGYNFICGNTCKDLKSQTVNAGEI